MIVDTINDWARMTPHKIAMVYNGNEINYLYFARYIEIARRQLVANAIPDGTTVVISISNLCDAWIIVLAARANGLTTVYVPTMHDIDALQLRNVSTIIITELEQKDWNRVDKEEKQLTLLTIPSSIFSNDRVEKLSDFSCAHPVPGAHILLSSGTSGRPKKLLVSSRFETAIYNEYPLYIGISSNTEFNLFNLSISSVSGYRGALATWRSNGAVVIDQTEDFKSLRRQSTNLLRLKPAIAKQLYHAPVENQPINEDLVAHIGGGPISADLMRILKSALTPRLLYSYAATELLYGMMLTKLTCEDDLIWQSKVPCRTIEIIDSKGSACPLNCEGQIRVKLLENDHTEYLDDHEATKASFRDGYFYPGDIAIQREDGRIRILGRISNVLIMNGHKYAIAPIEEELSRLLKVKEVCLFARQNTQTVEELFIVLECDGLPPVYELRAVQRDFQMFSKVHFWPFPIFPRNAGGKTDRLSLQRFIYHQTDNGISQ